MRRHKFVIHAMALIVETQAVLKLRAVAGQRLAERAEGGLGVLPADDLQGAPGVGHENGFVSDGSEITRAQSPERLECLYRGASAGHAGQGGLRAVAIPRENRCV